MKQFTKNVFITFRLLKSEKAKVSKDSEDAGFGRVSDYVRSKLGL